MLSIKNHKIRNFSNSSNEFLSYELIKRMEDVQNERNVKRIRRIVKKMNQNEQGADRTGRTCRTASEFWEDFKQEHLENALNAAENICCGKKKERGIQKIRKQKAFRPARYVAALLILTAVINTTTTAFAGVSIFQVIISWGRDAFMKRSYTEYFAAETISGYAEYSRLEDLESALKVSFYKPDIEKLGYELKSEKIENFSTNIYAWANYYDNENLITYFITVLKNIHAHKQVIEKADEDVEICHIDGTSFYIVENANWYVVTWREPGIDYSASGFVDKDSAVQFIYSLKKAGIQN